MNIPMIGHFWESSRAPPVTTSRPVNYGHGQSIHSSGLIDSSNGINDDKHIQVGGKERIINNDRDSMPLACKG